MQTVTKTTSADQYSVLVRVNNVKVFPDINIYYPMIFVFEGGMLEEVLYRPIPSQKHSLWNPNDGDDKLDELYAVLEKDSLRTIIGEMNGYSKDD